MCGLPEGLDDSGVAHDHDDARDQECDHQLVESEVYPEMEDEANVRAHHDYPTLCCHLYHCSRLWRPGLCSWHSSRYLLHILVNRGQLGLSWIEGGLSI